MSLAVIPTQANRIRALHAAVPELNNREIAARLGLHWHLVDLALSKGDTRRRKSVAK
jgi:hypothetical protein